MVVLPDYYERDYPEHCRLSCSDEHPINADVTGDGCRRCNAIFFTKAEAAIAELEQLKQQKGKGCEPSSTAG